MTYLHFISVSNEKFRLKDIKNEDNWTKSKYFCSGNFYFLIVDLFCTHFHIKYQLSSLEEPWAHNQELDGSNPLVWFYLSPYFWGFNPDTKLFRSRTNDKSWIQTSIFAHSESLKLTSNIKKVKNFILSIYSYLHTWIWRFCMHIISDLRSKNYPTQKAE